MYHESEGLFFDRLEDGSVKIIKRADARDGSEIIFEKVIPPNIWASIVCSVSKSNEQNGRYLEADKFHNS